MSTEVSLPALRASAGMLSGPAAFPFLRDVIAFLISAFDGVSQLIGSSESAGDISGVSSGPGLFRIS